ncbi:hypothetical protein [Corynebacterium kefirresidentii]|uniref:hypothetical protein n=1 Tax=Corynebacterium kefirresidentii TaxID=1979527 RepID=UPI001302E8DF|nr:hypothetical protein [Corynebacterium kefirresidentii]
MPAKDLEQGIGEEPLIVFEQGITDEAYGATPVERIVPDLFELDEIGRRSFNI